MSWNAASMRHSPMNTPRRLIASALSRSSITSSSPLWINIAIRAPPERYRPTAGVGQSDAANTAAIAQLER
jgi:hypothetical protein